MKLVLIVLLCLASAVAQAPVTKQQRDLVSAWNQVGQSIERENGYIDELTKSMRLNPPWRVVDAREPARRAELIDKIIAEHKRRIKLLETIKAEDRP